MIKPIPAIAHDAIVDSRVYEWFNTLFCFPETTMHECLFAFGNGLHDLYMEGNTFLCLFVLSLIKLFPRKSNDSTCITLCRLR